MTGHDRGAGDPPRPTTETPVSEVACRPTADGWTCEVVVGSDPARTQHTVTVRRETLDELAPGEDPERLVALSFDFLQEREPRSNILRRFELREIATYFADYPDEIRRRTR
jgi:hypothetical protein